MAHIFENDGRDAWAALHKGILAGLAGDVEPQGVIIQPLQVAERADWDSTNTLLNIYREQRIANQMPTWNAIYIPNAGINVPDEYQAFLDQLNSKIITDSGVADKDKLKRINDERVAAQDKLQKNEYSVNKQWDRYVANNRGKPPLSRPQWETEFGYAATRNNYRAEVDLANAAYATEVKNAGGDLLEVGRAISALSDPRQRIPLPQDEYDAEQTSENWQYWYRAGLSDSLQNFLKDTYNWTIELAEESVRTTKFEERWSGGASVSYFGFFGASGGVSNETIKTHAEIDTSSISINFKNIQSFAIDRGSWFKAGLISRFRDRMPPGFWGQAGRLNLIPTSVVLVRGMKIEVKTSSQVTDYFFNKRTTGGSAGFSIGPWRVGGSASKVTVEENYDMVRTATGFTLEDVSGRAQILAVMSIRNNDLLEHPIDPKPLYRELTAPEIRDAMIQMDSFRRNVEITSELLNLKL